MWGLDWLACRAADVIAAIVTQLDGQVAGQRDSYRMLARHQRPRVIAMRSPVGRMWRGEVVAVTAYVGRPSDACVHDVAAARAAGRR